MCEVSRKLIAWLDGELAADDAAEVGRHLRTCAECRANLNAYERVSTALDGYCDAVLAAEPARRVNHAKPVALAGGAIAAVAAVVVLIVTLPHGRKSPIPASPVTAPAAERPVTMEEVLLAPQAQPKVIHRRPFATHAQNQEARAPLPEAAIQISIPADAMFPPGAVPEGVNFVTEVRFPRGDASQEFFVWP
jgi:anti-sigma factor RsiW